MEKEKEDDKEKEKEKGNDATNHRERAKIMSKERETVVDNRTTKGDKGERVEKKKEETETTVDLPRIGDTIEAVEEDHRGYEVMKELGKGTFGSVYAVARRPDKKMYAMKCEHVTVKKQVLTMECDVLIAANNIKSPHFCVVVDKGRVTNKFLFICMTLLGKNLWDLRRERETQRFSIGTALRVAEQTLQAIRDLHKIGFLHRDLKPPNFAIGIEADNHRIFIIDFGLCRQFKTDNKEIRNQRKIAPFRGTARYASLTAHRNEEQSRRDDLEGWLYMVIEFTSGKLPWRHIKNTERDRMLAMKEDCRNGKLLEQLLEGCPVAAYLHILRYLDNLNYRTVPDYDYLWKMIDLAMDENGIIRSEPIDWDPLALYTGPRFIPDKPT